MSGSSLDALIEALRRLPGIGVKSAQRLAFHLLQHDREGAQRLAQALQAASTSVRHCERCPRRLRTTSASRGSATWRG